MLWRETRTGDWPRYLDESGHLAFLKRLPPGGQQLQAMTQKLAKRLESALGPIKGRVGNTAALRRAAHRCGLA
jgi:hypothetical protein